MRSGKRILIRKSVVFLLLWMLVGAAFLVQADLLQTLRQTLPKAVVYRSEGEIPVTWEKLQELREAEDTVYTKVELRTGLVANALTDRESEQLDLLLTDESYPDAVPLKLLYGGYFTVSPVPEENHYMVISDRLAVRFFLTDNAVGRTLRVNGREFQICGVYRSRDSLLHQVSSTGREPVYLPYSALPAEEKRAQLLYVRNKDDTLPLTSDSITGSLETEIGMPLNYETMSNYSEPLSLAAFTQKSSLFLSGMAVIGLLVVLLVGQGKRVITILSGETDRRAALRPGILGGCCVLLIAAVLLITCFHPELPSRLLPPDNVFDVGFYVKKAVSAVQTLNGSPVQDFYWRYSHSAVIGCAVWGALSVAAFYSAFFYSISAGKWIYRYEKESL